MLHNSRERAVRFCCVKVVSLLSPLIYVNLSNKKLSVSNPTSISSQEKMNRFLLNTN